MKRTILFLSLFILALSSACTVLPGRAAGEPTATVQPTSRPVVVTATSEPTAAVEPSATVEPEQVAPTEPASPTAAQPGDLGDLNAAGEALARAIEARDFAALRGLMRERFSIATWETSLMEYPSDEALQRLSDNALAGGSAPAVRFGTDVVALLEGADPLEQWGPVARTVRALHVMGLGPNGGDEAVLVIGRDEATGQFYWHGILLPRAGYFHSADPGSMIVEETDVQYVTALEELNARTGPGLDYGVVGRLRSGEVAQVTGVSPDGGWWRIFCTVDDSGICWVSADPALTRPTNQP